jgi:hypothetical protein
MLRSKSIRANLRPAFIDIWPKINDVRPSIDAG